MVSGIQLIEILNSDGVEAAFRVLFASEETEDGSWMKLLYEIQEDISSDKICALLKRLWIDDSDNVDREIAIKMFLKYGRESMSEGERIKLNSLAEEITIYRGGYGEGANLSWSLDKSKAIIFNGGNPFVTELVISKKEILAYYDCGEDEVIADV